MQKRTFVAVGAHMHRWRCMCVGLNGNEFSFASASIRSKDFSFYGERNDCALGEWGEIEGDLFLLSF